MSAFAIETGWKVAGLEGDWPIKNGKPLVSDKLSRKSLALKIIQQTKYFIEFCQFSPIESA